METAIELRQGFRVGMFLRLALPMIVSRAGLAAMAIADGIMVSRYRPVEFAWLSLAEGTLGRVLDIFIAFLIGGLLLASRHYSQGDAEGARMVWRRTLPVSVALGLAGALAGLFGSRILSAMGQRPDLAAGAAPVMAILGAGYPAALVAIAAAVYLEAIRRPQVVAVCVVAANLLNLGCNWLLIGGHFGIAAMGARGSALSTTIMRCALGLTLGVIAWHRHGAAGAGSAPAQLSDRAASDALAEERAASRRSQWRLSFGAAASVTAMIALSSSLILFAGRLGVLPLAVYSAAWGLAAPVALVTMGMADAAGIYVSAQDGSADSASIAWSSLRLSVASIGALALALVLAARACARLYAPNPHPYVLEAAVRAALLRHSIATMLPIVALILIADCVGFILASSLRAVRDAAWPPAIEISALLLLVPLAATLALWRGMGVRGLFLAMLVAGAVRAAMLAWRFSWCTRHPGLSGPDHPGSAANAPDARLAPDATLESLCPKM